MPNVKFFRHIEGIKGVKKDAPFGEKYFYKGWMAACDELGIEDLDLYGGTRHTTTTEIGKRPQKNIPATEPIKHLNDIAKWMKLNPQIWPS